MIDSFDYSISKNLPTFTFVTLWCRFSNCESCTTVLGMVPMAVGTGVGSEMWSSLGVTVASGLAFSTLITLFLIPVLFTSFAVAGQRRREKKAQKEAMLNA